MTLILLTVDGKPGELTHNHKPLGKRAILKVLLAALSKLFFITYKTESRGGLRVLVMGINKHTWDCEIIPGFDGKVHLKILSKKTLTWNSWEEAITNIPEKVKSLRWKKKSSLFPGPSTTDPKELLARLLNQLNQEPEFKRIYTKIIIKDTDKKGSEIYEIQFGKEERTGLLIQLGQEKEFSQLSTVAIAQMFDLRTVGKPTTDYQQLKTSLLELIGKK